jgi:hypothetical protein
MTCKSPADASLKLEKKVVGRGVAPIVWPLFSKYSKKVLRTLTPDHSGCSVMAGLLRCALGGEELKGLRPVGLDRRKRLCRMRKDESVEKFLGREDSTVAAGDAVK